MKTRYSKYILMQTRLVFEQRENGILVDGCRKYNDVPLFSYLRKMVNYRIFYSFIIYIVAHNTSSFIIIL